MSMSTTTKKLEEVLYDWAFSLIPSRVVIISNQVDGNSPNEPYISIRLTQSPTSQNPEVTLSDNGELETISQRCLFTVNVECVGDEAFQDAKSACIVLASSLYSANRYLDLWTVSGLGGVATGPQSLTTATLATNRSRWQFQYTLYAVIDNSFTGQYFDNLELKVIDGDTDTILLDVEIDGKNPPTEGNCNGNE